MPRSIQDILEHADELAQRFEDYEPSEGDEVPLEEYLLKRAVMARARCEGQIVEAVAAARSRGITWNQIGELLGTSPQAAQQRYGMLIEQTQANP
ncbi:hypothetical protein [Candidatus Poriferisocius sp.]|uniref:hypothetical protein n=1 Tax=Candidatus Poriferisocius sp. TaxID=3101276 RepID=UPI003B522EA5